MTNREITTEELIQECQRLLNECIESAQADLAFRKAFEKLCEELFKKHDF